MVGTRGSRQALMGSAASVQMPACCQVHIGRALYSTESECHMQCFIPAGGRSNPPENLVAHLRRWHAKGARYVVEWNGGPVDRIDRVARWIAKKVGLGHVTPHVFRHTAATWQMQAGTDLFEASKYLGMTVRTLEGTYGHHRPQHFTSARDAYRGPGRSVEART